MTNVKPPPQGVVSLQPLPTQSRGPLPIAKVVWALFLVWAVLVCLSYFATKHENVGQQAAAAAGHCFWLVAGYCGTRGVTELFR